MWDKIKNLLPKLLDKAKTSLQGLPKPVKWIALVYGGFVMLLWLLILALYIVAYMAGQASWDGLLALSREVTSPAAVGFAGFIVGLCIDTDNNGIPDKYEKEDKK